MNEYTIFTIINILMMFGAYGLGIVTERLLAENKRRQLTRANQVIKAQLERITKLQQRLYMRRKYD